MEESKKELIAERNGLGAIMISDEVVKVLAGIAASDVSGVAGMSGNLTDVFGRNSSVRGIKVEVKEKRIAVSMHLLVEYGLCIPDVAAEVQFKVKKAVEEFTGLTVTYVNVNIEGVRIGY